MNEHNNKLAEVEAEPRRLAGQANVIQLEQLRSPKQILQDNIFTLFNISLLGIALVQVLLDSPWDALISLGIALLNIGLNVVKELLAQRSVRMAEQTARLKATVIREGKACSISPEEIARGDMVSVGPGDQLFVDGQIVSGGLIVLDQSALVEEKDAHPPGEVGDTVYAGAYCVSGRAVYEAQKVGDERLISTRTRNSRRAREALTPLETLVRRVLSVLVAMVVVFLVLLLIKYFRWGTPVNVDRFLSAASVISSLAPAGLYFMIFLSYFLSTADLARMGALVHRARLVEALASATVLFFTESALRSITYVPIEPTAASAHRERLSKSRIRSILGDYSRTSSETDQAVRTMAEVFEGEKRTAVEEAPSLSVYGWSAIVFDEDDIRGAYVLGEPNVLQPRLAPAAEEMPDEEKTDERNGLAPLRSQRSSLSRRAGVGSSKVVPVRRETPADNKTAYDMGIEEVVYLFAYSPNLESLHGPNGTPQLPDNLIPVCHVHYTEEFRPETVDTLRAFADTGIDLKSFSSGSSDRNIAVLEQSGLLTEDTCSQRSITGAELSRLGPEAFARAASENMVFRYTSSEQATQIVRVLRRQGELVAVVGDGVCDVAAMQEANLSVARRSSSQAALAVADIVVLEESLQVLLKILARGQRTVNGIVDVLKIYLTHVAYLALLMLVTSLLLGLTFPIQSKQVSVIALVTVTLPSLGLTLWAKSGVSPRRNLGGVLARFVITASVAIFAASLAVYLLFFEGTADPSYTWLTMTHMLVFSGLALVVLISPPIRLRRSVKDRPADRPP